MLVEMREVLRGTDTKAKRNLLKKFVVWIEPEAERGNVAHTFPRVRTYIQYPWGNSS